MQLIKSKMKMPSFFMMAQQSGWYPQFLKPVADIVNSTIKIGKVLDIGTGPGMLPALLKTNDQLQITGTDISSSMIQRAKENVKSPNVTFFVQDKNSFKDISDSTFDLITICSVLFLLDAKTRSTLLDEVTRLLKPSGKIIVLTPSNKKSFLFAVKDVWRFSFSKYNWTFFVWKTLTADRGNTWQKEKWLFQYSQSKKFAYTISNVFYGYATIEIITKS